MPPLIDSSLLSKAKDGILSPRWVRFAWKSTNTALAKMDALFSRMYEADLKGERGTIVPEKLLRTMLLRCCTA